MRLSTKVAYNTIVQVGSKIVATLLGLFAVAIMARNLGRAGFGEYTTIITFLSIFAIAVDLGLTLITARMISQPGVDEKKVLNNLFSLRFFSALIFLGLSPVVVLFFPYSSAIKVGVAVTVFSFFFISLNQVFVGFFQTKLRMDKVSIAEVVGRAVLLIGVIIVAKTNFGLLGFMGAVVAGSAVSFLLQFIFSQKFVRIGFAFDFSLWGEIFKKCWPLALTIIFNLLYLKTDILILSLIKSQEEVGIYGATYKVIEVLTMIPFMFAGIILPILTANWTMGDKGHYKKVLQKSFDLILILIIPLIIGTQFLATNVMVLVAGQEFAPSGLVLRVLIVAAGLVFISCLFSHAVVAIDKQKKIIGAYVFTGVTSVIGYLIFIPKFSYIGAASVTIYSELAITLFMIYYIIKFTSFFPNLKILFKALLAALVMGVLLYFIPQAFYASVLGLILVLIASTVVYFTFLYLFKGIAKEDIHTLLNKKTR